MITEDGTDPYVYVPGHGEGAKHRSSVQQCHRFHVVVLLTHKNIERLLPLLLADEQQGLLKESTHREGSVRTCSLLMNSSAFAHSESAVRPSSSA